MSAEEATIGSTPDVSGSVAPSGSTPADSSSAPATAGTPSQDVNTDLSQSADDPLAGVPTTEELQALVEQKTPHAEALSRLRGAYESIKPQFDELQTKFKPFEPYADRFSDPAQIEQLINLQDNLWKMEPDPQTGEVVPVTRDFAEGITQSAPETADRLTYDLVFGQTYDSTTGQPTRRLDVLIKDLAQDPAWKNHIVKLAGYDPTQAVAPTWDPTPEELEKVEPELVDVFKKLPYEKRVELAENSKPFVNDYLRTQKLYQDAEATKAEAAQQQIAHQQQQQEVFRQEAIAAGNSYIDSEVNTAFSGFFDSLVERYKPTADPAINRKFGLITAGLTLALSHNETRGPLLAAIKELGIIDDGSIQNFDKARNDFAQNAFNYGNKSYVRGRQRPNGVEAPDLGVMKSAASRSMQSLIGQANSVAAAIYKVLDEALVAKAASHNNDLEQEVPRQIITGQPTTINPQQRRPITGKTREEIWGNI